LKPLSISARWWSWLGRVKAKRGDYQSALRYFERIISADPRGAYAHALIGHCHAALKEYQEAVKAYDHALPLRPDWAYPRAELGSIFSYLKKPQQAVEELNRAFRIDPKLRNTASYQRSLGSALVQLGQTNEALDAYKAAVQLDLKWSWFSGQKKGPFIR
jgi:tetratricopeptide (TPR) repeat protein